MPASAAERKAFAAEMHRLIEVERVASRAELADRLGISRQIVSAYVNGTKAPGDRDRATAIDEALGADGAVLTALGYVDRRPSLEERVTRIEQELGITWEDIPWEGSGVDLEADGIVVEMKSAADKGRSAGKGRRRTRPSPEPEPEGP